MEPEARIIEYLVTLGLDLDDLTCVGHSLGNGEHAQIGSRKHYEKTNKYAIRF